ncbi:hypothetical protein lerEdw1_003421 [Lerista edwardsae]|nr:hypothetical protein lerEdw1_003421 [Lerista edwardsae]
MAGRSLSADLPKVNQALDDLPDGLDVSLRQDDDASSLGSDSEMNGMDPYRQTDRYGFLGGSCLQDGGHTKRVHEVHEVVLEVHEIPVSDRDLERECQVQLAKMRKGWPEFQYNPQHRLSGAKAIFDAQQLEHTQNNEENLESLNHTFHIPQIKVEPPTLSPKEKKELETASKKEDQKKEKARKKPDTRGKTFHSTQQPVTRREKRPEPDIGKKKSSFYVETWF